MDEDRISGTVVTVSGMTEARRYFSEDGALVTVEPVLIPTKKYSLR